MGRSNTDDSISSSVSIQTNYTTTLPPLLPSLPPPSSDSFLTLQLADYLDMQHEPTTHNNTKDTTVTALTTKHTSNPLPRLKIKNDSPSSSPPSSSSTSSLSSSSDEDATTISPLLWVPADQHPEIAPGEFTKWLETNGSNNLARRKSSLRRKSSVLSQTHVPTSEEETDDDTMGQQQQQPTSIVKSTSLMAIPESTSGQKDNNTLDFDRYSPSQDTSRVLAPRGNRSLLRRSAFSARGRGRKLTTSTRRHGNTTSLDEPTTPTSHQQEDQASPETVNTSEPIRLYDRPVSMNEWVDLGSASLSGYSGGNSQQDILSRVHDAESHILSQLSDDTDTATTTNLTTGIDDLKPMTEDQPIETLPPPPLSDNNNNNSNYFNQDQQDHLIPSSQPDQTTPLPTRKTMGDKESSLPAPIITAKTTALPPSPTATITMTTTTKKSPGIQRSSSERSYTKQERKSKNSWFGGLFGSSGNKEKRRSSLRRVEDERCAQEKQQRQHQEKSKPISQPPPSPTPTQDTTGTNKKSGLGSLFSRSNSKKRHHFQKLQQHVMSGMTMAAPLLLSNSNNNNNLLNKKALQRYDDKPSDYLPSSYHSYRLPIHVERAIYRLSHYKLADPRRPLRHQVAISNLMFWYLSIIHHDSPTLLSTYAQQQQQQQQQPTNTILAASSNTPSTTLHAHFDDSLPRVSYPIATPQEQSDDDDDDDDGDDDDLPLSYYKQA